MSKLPLEDGEKVELQSPGAFSPEAEGRWRLGEWIKTDRRMLFIQGDSVRFWAGHDSLVEIAPCEREYSFKKKRCLKIIFNDGGDNKIFWFITPDIVLWEDKLSEYLEDSLTEDDIVKVANCLGHSAEKILWHLYRKRHATISELMDVAGAGSHMDVLNIIRKEINKASQDLINRSVLVFKPEGMDQNGRKIAYSWWFAGCKIAKDSPFCDIIDEGDFYRIIAEAPEDAEVVANNGTLAFVTKSGFKNTIKLPKDAKGVCGNRHYRNGILEIRLEKS